MDGRNPYSSSNAPMTQALSPLERDIPDSISGPIRQGWIAACVAMALLLIVGLAGFAASRAWPDLLILLDLPVIAVLAFGLHKRSRTAATLLVLMSVLPKLMLIADGQLNGVVFGLVFAIFYIRAMTATYRYHRFVKNWQRNPPAPRGSLADNPAFSVSGSSTASQQTTPPRVSAPEEA